METLTFLNTDIEGSTLLLRRVGNDTYAAILADHHRIIREQLDAHGGREEGTAGDSFFAVFTSPSSCVSAVVAMQEALAAFAWPGGEAVRVRMGVHTGEASENATGFVGYEVHRAARIAAIGHGGQVLLSSATAALVEDALEGSLSLKELGSHRLKDLGRPETIFQLSIPTLPSTFPPLRSLDNPEYPHNLPTSLNEFIGRESDLAEVRAIVAQARLVTLTGAGGSGKTRLALQTAAEVLGTSKDGVWFVELASITDPALIPNAVATAMSLSLEGDLDSTTVLLRSLKEQNAVVVFDNCEHLIDEVADLLQKVLVQCPKVKLIATSREPLGVSGEEVYRVKSLTLPAPDAATVEELAASDSAQLFITRGRSVARSFEVTDATAPLVASIVRRLDGIPLAIELAAARLASMSIQDLHERLDQRFRLLTGGSRGALPRHQTLGAMVSWSFDLLNENERAVLRRLTAFVDGFELKAAEAVGSTETIDEWDVADIVGALVNKSLVTAEHNDDGLRYRLLETIRQYAAEQLIATGGEAEILDVRARHANYFLSLAEKVGPEVRGKGQVEALRRLDPERGNILAAFAHFASQDSAADEVLRLAVALSAYYRVRSIIEAAGYYSTAVRAYPNRDSLLWATAVQHMISNASSFDHVGAIRDFPDTIELLEAALATARQHGDAALAALTCCSLATNFGHRHLEEEHNEWARRALQEAEGCNDLFALSAAHIAYGFTVEGTERKEHQELALKYRKEMGDAYATAQSLFAISWALSSDDDDLPARSVALLREAHRLASSIDSTAMTTKFDSHMGLWLTASQQYEEAEVRSRRSILAYLRLGLDVGFIAWDALTMAELARVAGNHERSVVLMGWALHQLKDGTGSYWNKWEREFVANIERDGRAALGDARYDQLFAHGESLSRDDAAAVLKEPTALSA